jgi:hypothetical protein
LSLSKPVEAGLLGLHGLHGLLPITFYKRMKNVNRYYPAHNIDTVASGNHPNLAA